MASRRGRRWKARVKFMYTEHFLGYYDTQDEAEQAERDARVALTGVPYPTRRLAR